MAELRATRDRLAARFNYDVEAIFRHIQAEEARSGLTYVQCPPRPSEAAPSESRARGRAGHTAAPPAIDREDVDGATERGLLSREGSPGCSAPGC